VRRPRWERASRGLFAIWFVIVVAEPAALHSCPVHSGHAVIAESGPSGAHASHGRPSHERHQQCTCIGTCTACSGTNGVVGRAGRPHAGHGAHTRRSEDRFNPIRQRVDRL
jgi:hypothetical protein